MRHYLLNKRTLQEIDLSPEDIAPANRLGITKVSLINAMLPLESAPVIPISEIYFT